MTVLKIGDTVTWKSQAKGNMTRKTGRVVFIPKGDMSSPTKAPWLIAKNQFPGHRIMFDGNRFREGSVLVEVAAVGRAKPRLYLPWPGVVKKVTDEAT
ncbi:hypothetical protein HVE01_30630 [Vreelandella venusta]|nr:hypothetical protein HVE01_30630 [Halomonas venusta]